jgi:hypothetical protein
VEDFSSTKLRVTEGLIVGFKSGVPPAYGINKCVSSSETRGIGHSGADIGNSETGVAGLEDEDVNGGDEAAKLEHPDMVSCGVAGVEQSRKKEFSGRVGAFSKSGSCRFARAQLEREDREWRVSLYWRILEEHRNQRRHATSRIPFPD